MGLGPYVCSRCLVESDARDGRVTCPRCQSSEPQHCRYGLFEFAFRLAPDRYELWLRGGVKELIVPTCISEEMTVRDLPRE